MATGVKDFIDLTGTPYQNGKKIGMHSKSILLKRVEQVLKIRKIKKIPSRLIDIRIKDFTEILLRTSPHWLEEIKGQADACGVSPDELILLNCLPDGFYSGLPPGFYLDVRQNCSSFVYIGDDKNILFKIRDEKNFPQAFLSLNNKGFFFSQAGRDIGNIGFAHFVNEKALGGANNTGSFTKHPTDKPLLNDCHVMRYISERAGSIGEIPALIEKLIDKGVLGGAGSERGAIFLFADREGGLLVECDSMGCVTRFISGGRRVVSNHFTTAAAGEWESKPPNKNTLLRRKRLRDLLSKSKNGLSPAKAFSMSRDRKNAPDSLCNDNLEHFWMTVSAQCQFIEKKEPEKSFNYICCGNTLHSAYVPVPLAFRGTYLPFLDGSFYRAAERSYLSGMACDTVRPEIEKWEKGMLGSRKEAGYLFRQAYEKVSTPVSGKSSG